MALTDYQKWRLERAENVWLREPEDQDDDRDIYPDETDEYVKVCKLCECHPIDDYLYNKDGEWVCADCLLDCFDKRDVFTGEFFYASK